MNYSILILLLLSTSFLFSQTPDFQFKIFIEDAVGSRDTVTIGYDDSASDGIDIGFGEVDIMNEPWGDELEVRLGNATYCGLHYFVPVWLSNTTEQTKKNIMRSNGCDDLYSFGGLTIQFHTLEYPITLKWDKNLFQNDSCATHTYFFGMEDHFDFNLGGYVMLQNSDSLVINSTFDFLGEGLFYLFQDNRKIGALNFVFQKPSTLGVNNHILENSITISPNPFNEFFTIDIDTPISNISLTDLSGKLIDFNQVENKIYPESCVKGIYILSFESNGIYFNHKLIKN